MIRYRYLFHDLLTNTPLAELELKGVSYGLSLNDAGDFAATINIASPVARKENVMQATVPGRTAVYIDRDGTIVWGGILWKRSYEPSSTTLSLDGKTFESYLSRRRITNDLSYPNTDILQIARNLLVEMQSQPYGDIGIEIGSELSGQAASRYFFWFELKNYLEVLQLEAGVAITGFDFRINVFRDPTTKEIRKVFELAHPRIGVTLNNSQLLWEFPGNVVNYTWPEDAESGATQWHATGANEGEALMVATSTASQLLDSGWPLLEDSASYADVTDWSLLTRHANADIRARQAPVLTPDFTVYGDEAPLLGTYLPGDYARFRILDDRFPDGLDISYRIYGIKVAVSDTGNRETVTLSVGVTPTL